MTITFARVNNSAEACQYDGTNTQDVRDYIELLYGSGTTFMAGTTIGNNNEAVHLTDWVIRTPTAPMEVLTDAEYLARFNPLAPGRSFNNAPGRGLVTGTGATGFQVSSTRDAHVSYNVTTSTTATIGGASSATVVLEIAPTNSATPGDWLEVSRLTNSQTITLAVALQSVQLYAGKLSADVPAGYFVKLRQTTAGTASCVYNSGQEVLL